MNSPGLGITIIGVLFFAETSLVRGTIIVADAFDYGPVEVTVGSGLNGGLGFNGGWHDSFPGGPTPLKYTPAGLSFAGLATSGGAVTSVGIGFPPASLSISRGFGVVLPATAYGSYLLQPIGLFTAGLALQDAFGGGPTVGFEAPTQGIGSPAAAAIVGIQKSQSGPALIVGQTYLQIFKYQRSGGTYTATEWLLSEGQFVTFKAGGLTEQELNGASIGTGSANVWSRASVTALRTTGITVVGLYNQNGIDADPDGIIQDELRISNASIDDATPAVVPEPAALALICSSVLILHRRRPVRGAQRPLESAHK